MDGNKTDTFKLAVAFLKSKLKQKGFGEDYLELITTYELSKTPSSVWKMNKTRKIQLKPALEDQKDEAELFNEEIRKFESENEELTNFVRYAQLETKPRAGSKFITIKDVKKLLGEEINIDIDHKPGQILFVGAWATWSESSRKSMTNYQNILSTYGEIWGDKVRFVSLSVDESKEEVVKKINQKHWDKMEHVMLEEGWDSNWDCVEGKTLNHNVIVNYVGRNVPLGILLNQEGIIDWVGNPLMINIEDKINGLLNSKDLTFENESKKSLKKYMKEQLYPRLKEMTSEKHNFEFSLVIIKEKNYMNKSVYQQPEIICKYSVKKKEEPKRLLDEIFSNYNKEIFKLKETVIDHQENLKNALRFFQEQLTKNNLAEVILKYENISYFTPEEEQFGRTNSRVLVPQKGVSPDKSENVENLNKALREFFETYPHDQTQFLRRFRLNASIDVGSDFFPFEANELFSGNVNRIEHKKGEVILLDFWATWCEPCQKPMAHNQEMVEKNEEKWKGSVRFVGVSTDYNQDDVIETVNRKNWKKIEHYKILSDDQKTSDLYGINSIPCIFLINKEGKVVYRGHPDSINIEDKINELLQAKDGDLNEAEYEKNNGIEQEKYKKLVKLLNGNELKKSLSLKELPNAKFNVIVRKARFYDANGKLIAEEYSKPIIQLELRVIDYNRVKPILSQIFTIVPEDRCKVQKKLLETVSIKFGEECNACEKELKPFDPQYYCKFCSVWFCERCGDKVYNTKIGLEQLIHPHHLAWIRVKKDTEMQAIDEYKFGKNLPYNGNQNHPASCNGCDHSIHGPRWICLSCRPGPIRPNGFVDLCNQCINILKNESPVSQKYKKIINHLAHEKHDPDSHIFLRVFFSNGEYYEY